PGGTRCCRPTPPEAHNSADVYRWGPAVTYWDSNANTGVYNMSTKITLDAFESLLHCKMKARLRLTLQQGVKSHCEAMITEIRHQVRLKAIEKISSNYNADSIARALPVKRSALAAGAAFVLDAELINRDY